MIKTRVLGNSDLKVSEVSFGGMSLGQDHKQNEVIIHQAIETGINLFDTADLYDHGFNEETLGRAVGDQRKDICIASKVGNIWNADRTSWRWGPTKAYILKAIDDTLSRLNTDYLDLYQLHGGTLDDPVDEIIDAFETLKDAGKIRAYGISSIRPNVIREYVKRSQISCVMLQYSALDRRPEESVLALLAEANVGVLCRGTLARGLLINKPAKAYLGYSETQVAELQQKWKSQGDPLAMSMGFVLDHSSVSSAVLGIRSSEQLFSIMTAYNSQSVHIPYLLEPNQYEVHR